MMPKNFFFFFFKMNVNFMAIKLQTKGDFGHDI